LTTTLVIFSPFLLPTKNSGKKKERMNNKNRDQKSCLSARSIVVAEHSYTAPQLQSYSAVATTKVQGHILECVCVWVK